MDDDLMFTPKLDIRIKRYNDPRYPDNIKRAIRLYCQQHRSVWNLQIRGPLGTGPFGYTDSKSGIIANAHLNRKEMEQLRENITALLENTHKA